MRQLKLRSIVKERDSPLALRKDRAPGWIVRTGAEALLLHPPLHRPKGRCFHRNDRSGSAWIRHPANPTFPKTRNVGQPGWDGKADPSVA